jgi:antirestriction protein ArdC
MKLQQQYPKKKPVTKSQATILMNNIAQSVVGMITRGYEEQESRVDWDKEFHPVSNGATTHNYTGSNRWWLENIVDESGRQDKRFLTYKQCGYLKDEDGQPAEVKPGEKGVQILRPIRINKKMLLKNDEDIAGIPEDCLVTEEDGRQFKLVPITIYNMYTVFSVEQTTAKLKPQKGLTPRQWQDNDFFEKFVKASGVKVLHDQKEKAFYLPDADEVHLPSKDAFSRTEQYYATKMHEWCHATGHADREGRDQSGSTGSDAYAMEELRAEFFSLACQKIFGLSYPSKKQVQYIDQWQACIKDNKAKSILKAARDVDKLIECITDVAAGKQPSLKWFPKVDFRDMPMPLKELAAKKATEDALEKSAEVARKTAAVKDTHIDGEEPDTLEICRFVLPPEQVKVFERGLSGTNARFYKDLIQEITQKIHEMPGIYAQEPDGDDAVAFLHFTGNACEYYLTELDIEGEIAYGLKVQNDVSMGMDEIPLDEIQTKANRLDYDFEPTTVAKVLMDYESAQYNYGELPEFLGNDYGDPYQDFHDTAERENSISQMF